MMKFNRNERRFQTKRLKAKRKNYWGMDKFTPTAKQLGVVSRTPRICSCAMCSNGSKIFGNSTQGKHKHELSDLEVIRKGLV